MLTGFANGTVLGERFGEGPIEVVALHGWQRSHRDFSAVLGAHARGAISLDLAGFGATPAPPRPWGSPEYAASLLPVLDEIGIPVVVVGHSFGGRVAIQLATMAPELVGGLVLTGVPQLEPSSAVGRPSRRFRALRFGRRLGIVSDGAIDRARSRYGSRDYREADGVLRDVLVTVLQERYAPLLGGIAQPVELIWGALDTTAPISGARYAQSVMPRAHLVELDGVGHLVPTEAPTALADAISRVSQ
jgi:pimeloyl-ACP methyl ester carboxylesterase